MNKKEEIYILNNIRWLIKGAFCEVLKEILASTDIDTEKNCEIVRRGYFKKVLKYTDKQESFYIKQYTARHSIDIIKSLFSASKAHREWNQSQVLLKNQLLTAEPVAIGEKRHYGMLRECFIISKAVPNGISIKELLVKIQQSSADYKPFNKKSLLSNLISYVRMVHDKGILHGELHAENILVDIDSIASFYLLDLGRTKFRKTIPLHLKIHELARLLYSVTDVCTNKEITEMINNYTDQKSVYKNRQIFQKAVFNEIHKIKRRLWHSRTSKCLKNNNVFKITKYDKYSVNMRKQWDINVLVALINKHTVSLKERLNNVIKASSKIGITCVPVSNDTTNSVCIKEYKYPSFLKRFLYSFHNSPARKAWFAAHGLLTINIKTPKPIALLEEKKYLIIKKSFIIMEDISTCLPCNKYVNEQFNDPYDKIASERKKKFVSRMALSFRQLHDSKVYHGDLKANNIMIMELQDNWDFFYLDLDRVHFDKKITLKKMVKNLSQLNASIPNCITYTDRLRFYRTYTGMKNLNIENKQILRAIIRLSIKRKHVWTPRTQITPIS